MSHCSGIIILPTAAAPQLLFEVEWGVDVANPVGVVPGFNVVGHLTSRTGLGAAARMTWDLIDSFGWPQAAVDLELSTTRIPLSRLPVENASFDHLPYSVNLIHTNPPNLMGGLLGWDSAYVDSLASRLMVAVPYWELPVMTPLWSKMLRAMDVVLAPSRFIEDAVVASIPEPDRPPVLYFLQSVPVPKVADVQRGRWFGERSGTTVFVSSFDFSSDVNRKNPWAVVAAFQAAFQGRYDVSLVFKTGGMSDDRAAKHATQLRNLASSDERIMLIEDVLSDGEMDSLLASGDAYVSLHRAEGLGLGMMSAMAAGVPVIATGWSGNTDFMTDEDSCLVRYTPVRIETDYHPEFRALAGRTRWAEPDPADAVHAMRTLADDRAKRTAFGLAARRAMLGRREEYERADVLERVLEMSSQPLSNAARADRIDRLAREARWSGTVRNLRSGVGSVARKVRLRPPLPDGIPPRGPMRLLDPNDMVDITEGGRS